MAQDTGADELTPADLVNDGEAQAKYVNISASFEVGVLPSDENDELTAARELAKREFEEQFGFKPGMRSEISAQRTGQTSILGEGKKLRKKYSVTIITQNKQ